MKKLPFNPVGFSVRFKTELCDAQGRVERVLSQGHNEITDWGMDALNDTSLAGLTSYLHLSDTIGPAKRVMTGGTTLSLVITSPTSIAVTASANFFLSGDAGNTLWIDGLGQELKIVTYNSATSVTCSTRPGAWLPSVGTPGTGPFSAASVHFTSINIVANQTQKFNSYDTTVTNYAAVLNDSSHSRWNNQYIWLSAVVTGTAWTIKQLGWSNGNGSNNVFGKANLSTTDTVPVGKRYRVTANFYSVYTPLNLTSQTLDFGTTVGSYTADIRQEVMPNEGIQSSAFRPNSGAGWYWPYTSTFTLSPTKWEGDSGFSKNPHGTVGGHLGGSVDSSYVSGAHNKIRSFNLFDSETVSAATGIVFFNENLAAPYQVLAIKFTSGTFTKPSGWYCSIPFQIFWTRELLS